MPYVFNLYVSVRSSECWNEPVITNSKIIRLGLPELDLPAINLLTSSQSAKPNIASARMMEIQIPSLT